MRLPITGMSCQGCAQTIAEAVSRLPGARDVHVNFALKFLSFEGLSKELVVQTVRSLGYDVDATSESVFKSPEVEKSSERETSSARRELILAAVLGVPEFIIGMWGMHGVLSARSAWWAFPLLQACLTFAVVFGAGFEIHKRALKQLHRGQLTMDTLVSLGSTAAFLESCVIWLKGSPHWGFETASTIVLFILAGRYLEARARRQTFSATAELFKTFQQPVVRLGADGDKEEQIQALEIQVGDHIRIKPGEICPADGKVVDGLGQMDESSVTGESRPRAVKPGDFLLSGAVLLDSPLTFAVERAGADCFIGRLILELENAEAQPVKLQRLADHVTAWFVPAVILTASLAALGQFWWWNNPVLAFNVFLSVLLVACPCALGLAIPTALVAGLGASARRGVLFNDTASLEACAALRHLYFDKTGTLTRGQPKLIRLEAAPDFDLKQALAWAAAVERHSLHPVARAFLEAARNQNLEIPRAERERTLPGVGVSGMVQGHHVSVERVAALTRANNQTSSKPCRNSESRDSRGDGVSRVLTNSDGLSCCDVLIDDQFAARAFFADEVRGESLETLRRLKAMGFSLHLLTGDNEGAVKKSGLYEIFDSVRTDLFPGDKKRAVETALEQNPGSVAFVGDGVNDVLALKAAAVGFAVASGTPAALGAGAVSLSRGIVDLPLALSFAWKTRRQLKFNLFWAFAYNAVMLPWAVSGGLAPLWASLAMSASSVTVVLGSVFLAYRLRLLRA